MSNNEILRKQSLGFGMETTAGTPVNASFSLPTMGFNLKHAVAKKEDTSGYGVIDEQVDSHITQEGSELEASFIARSQTIGYFLKCALGAAGAATLVETGVYSHAITRANNNDHPTMTVYRDGVIADERAAFHIVDTFELDAQVGEYIVCKVNTKGGKIGSATYSPSYLTGLNDEPFVAAKCSVKFASDIAGLAAADPTPLTGVKFTIKKNPKGVYVLGSTELNANQNQQFGVSGDFTAQYTANTIRDLFTANTKQAMEITITGGTLIGATKYNQIVIQFAQLELTEWNRDMDLNNLIEQEVGFVGEYNFTNTQTMNVFLQNKKNSDY